MKSVRSTLSFDLSGLNYSIANPEQFSLLIDDDTTFSDATVYTSGRNITEQTISFTNLNLNQGQYFTLATTDTINHNPTATDSLVTIDEDTLYSFSAMDFGFDDQDAEDSLVKVLITRLPRHGTLALDGIAIAENQSIELADIPQLTFTPNSNQFGEEYTNFEFKVNDGEASSLDSNQITITVDPVVDSQEIFFNNQSDIDDGTVVDIMIVYTQGALNEAGSEEVFKQEIEQEIAYLNEALVRSGVSFTANVVHYGLVKDYQGVDNRTDLSRLNNATDGYMDQVHDWRNQYSADFVSLITTGAGTGIGYEPGAFNALSYGVRYNLDHELGHNFGAYHDIYNGGNASIGIAGYRSLEKRISTVMSYGQGGTTWIRTFSNPNLIINDVALGSVSANNVGWINSRAMISANLRHSNDNLARAAEITGSDFSIQALNINATTEAEELKIADVSGGKSVWWSWTAPNNNPVEFNTIGSDFNTLLAVYTGTDYFNLQLVTQNDNDLDNTSNVTFTPVAGKTYKIAVAGKGSSSGQIQLNLATLQTLPMVSTVSEDTASEASLDPGIRVQKDSINDGKLAAWRDRSKRSLNIAKNNTIQQPTPKEVESPAQRQSTTELPATDHNLQLIEVDRFSQYGGGYHFYTANDRESRVIQELSSTKELKYSYEGESFTALSSNLDSLSNEVIEEAKPVYRFFNQITGAHLFTMDVKEKDYIVDNLDNYSLESTAYYALSGESELDTIPVYRMLNNANGTHIFTSNPQEANYIQGNLSNFSFEGNDGIAFYVFDSI